MTKKPYDIVAPEPAALIESLRSVGYSLPSAIADILDNSVTAGAKNIHINFRWAGRESSVLILDDGRGMSEDELRAAMRPGSRNPLEKRALGDLGRFGLGLKTASLSHCRNLCVVSKVEHRDIHARTWDLDKLANSPEWRLLVEPSLAAQGGIDLLMKMSSGTAVVWSSLDRLVGNESSGHAVAHSRFNNAIDEVREHLSLVFHRYIESRSLTIQVNGSSIAPWNPFMKDAPVPSSSTPEEIIQFEKTRIAFQGFVLPHKDALSEEEFIVNAGPRGWTGQQGFYVYRNKRLLVYGDWLRLGRPTAWTREEHYRLARIRLDISNDSDAAWHLDVMKSSARPPALIRERLTDLAENVRAKARSVFAHRGKYGRRSAPLLPTERPWTSSAREGRRIYSINRVHPVVEAVTRSFPEKCAELEMLLRLLEETVPVEQIWLDTAEQVSNHAAPYDGVELSIIKSDMHRVVEYLTRSGINRQTAIERLRTIEPFDRLQKLINEL